MPSGCCSNQGTPGWHRRRRTGDHLTSRSGISTGQSDNPAYQRNLFSTAPMNPDTFEIVSYPTTTMESGPALPSRRGHGRVANPYFLSPDSSERIRDA